MSLPEPLPFLFGGHALMRHLKTARVLLLGGPLRTGKTLFATAFSYWMLQNNLVDYAVGNYPCDWFSAPYPRRSLWLMDEAGILFDKRTSYKDNFLNDLSLDVTSYLGKRQNYLFLASHAEVDKRFERGVYMVRVLETPRLWLYAYRYAPSRGRKVRGFCSILNPSFWFGTYDTEYEPPRELTIDMLRHSLS